MIPAWIKKYDQFIAPTVYKLAGVSPAAIPKWAYYNTFNQAQQRYEQLINNSSAPPITPAGNIPFTTTVAQTIGINADFYIPFAGSWYNAEYKHLKKILPATAAIICRIHLTSGAPAYIIAQTKYMGFSATVITSNDPARTAAMDQFHRETQLLKFRYNALASFLNKFAERELSQREQQIFNEGILKLQNLNTDLRGINGIEHYYSEDGKIGLAQLLLIAIVLILSGSAAWTVSKIITEAQKTKRINDSFDLVKWMADKKAAIAADPNISEADKRRLFKSIDAATNAGIKVAKDSAEDEKGLFGNLANVVKWAAVGFIGYAIINNKKAK